MLIMVDISALLHSEMLVDLSLELGFRGRENERIIRVFAPEMSERIE